MKVWRKTKRLHSQQPILPGLITAQSKSHRLATPHEQALEIARARIGVGLLFFAIAFCVIAGRVAFLTLLNDAPETPAQHQEASDGISARADITDRNGILLATSLPTESLCADSKKIMAAKNVEVATKALLGVLPGLDADRLNEDLRNGKHCVMIKRHLTPKQQYEVNTLGIAGLEFQPDERRVYPAGAVTAHVVGYTDIDNNGIAGMESALDDTLEKKPEAVALSIDLRVQTILRRNLLDAMSNFHAAAAAGLVMDINTGEMLAMVSLPDFDPQHPGEASADARFNRDTLGVYEMGSTFKIFNTSLALNSGLVHLNDTFDVTKALEIGHHKIRDFHPENRWLNVAEVFTHSSNIGSALMVERIGAARQRAFLSRLNLTDKMPFELPENSTPLAPSAHDWSEATMMTAAYGHGIAVNALQMAGAVGTIVNNGLPVHPTILKRSMPVADDNADEDRVISSHTSAIMRGLMRLVVTRGTAKQAETNGYLIGGKTGTADKVSGHGYDSHARLSSFIGVFPLNHPKYLVFALLDDPKGTEKTAGYATGGMVAAPIVGHVVSQIGPLLGMQPLSPDMEAAAERQLLKPLGALNVDGIPVEEGSSYASVETHSVQ